MTEALSTNTQAILLLTAPLLAGGQDESSERLTAREYKALARHLRSLGRQPADLLGSDADGVSRECARLVEPGRLGRLLGRGFLLAQVMERWRARSIWVVSRADATYPRRLKARLKEEAPAVLYGCGEASLLDEGGLAVVGSRRADETLLEYTRGIGRLVAASGRAVISGGARGVDQAAVSGAIAAAGRAVGVLADSLEKASTNREHRSGLKDGRLALVSPYDPSAGFNVGNAMQRNKLIYALSDAALVVSSDVNKGGTWAGAVEQLGELRLVPVYVRSSGPPGEGLEALRQRGALPWPNPIDDAGVARVLRAEVSPARVTAIQAGLPFDSTGKIVARDSERPPQASTEEADTTWAPASMGAADELFAKVREVVRRALEQPATESELSAALQVSKAQVRLWLLRLIDEGRVQRIGRSHSYANKSAARSG